jgi:hypothetical protein
VCVLNLVRVYTQLYTHGRVAAAYREKFHNQQWQKTTAFSRNYHNLSIFLPRVDSMGDIGIYILYSYYAVVW